MARSHWRWLTLGAIAFALILTPTAQIAGQKGSSSKSPVPVYGPAPSHEKTDDQSPICKIYPLGDLGSDGDVAKWVADTIPQVIEPATWNKDGAGKNILTYNAATKVLVVYHTAAVQTKVGDFIDGLKKALPSKHATAPSSKPGLWQSSVIPAGYLVPAAAKANEPGQIPTAYAVPPATPQPKHLFHFIIRYEGDGIIDSNVVEFMKVQMMGQKNQPPVASYAPSSGSCQPATSPGTTGSMPSLFSQMKLPPLGDSEAPPPVTAK